MADSPQNATAVLIEQICSAHLGRLQAELGQKLGALDGGSGGAAATDPCAPLNSACALISSGANQAEILRSLLNAAADFSIRAALFVVRESTLSIWQTRGFENAEQLKSKIFDANAGVAGAALRDKIAVATTPAEFGRHYGIFADEDPGGKAVILPLIVKDKVSALLYADASYSGDLNRGALEVLVRTTGMRLEILALRKATTGSESAEPAAKVASPTPAPPTPPPAPAPPMATAVTSPVAAAPASQVAQVEVSRPAEAPGQEFAPGIAPPVAPPVSAPEPQGALVSPAEITSPKVSASQPLASSAAAAAPPVAAEESPADREIHSKAKRFAKLLVDEIKLYNQPKVEEGRRNSDIYERLRDDIEKSKTTYDKRYGNTVAASSNYFAAEALRILANGDPALLGPNPLVQP